MSKPLNAAQQILSFLGVPVGEVVKQAHGNKNPSATKAGPGRHHREGHEKASPRKGRGADAAFAMHPATSQRKARRELVAKTGRRQALKTIKLMRAEAKAARHQEQPELA